MWKQKELAFHVLFLHKQNKETDSRHIGLAGAQRGERKLGVWTE